MWNRLALYSIITVAIVALVATVVNAMTVSPVVIDLQTSGQRMSQVITIENKYARPIILEMTVQEAEYTDDGVKGTGKPTDDLLVFPPQAQVAPGGTQAVRVQYVGDPDLPKSKHYFVSVNQLPVKLPEGESAVQLLYNFQVVTGVSVPGKRPNIKIESAETYMGGDNNPRLLLVLTNDADTYGYLSGGSLKIVQKDSSGKEIFHRTMTGEQISQEIGFGLVGAGQKRRMTTPIILPQMGGQIEASYIPSRR
ncbi:molecular chaperone [Sphingopyxis lindanitolerans]|uniref:Molecular chaperone n=1 Tax=Sphingopyxis lindanitolerans TaxID=2054227 RepID=A0A2S8B844_9SPHN|nr:fimbria/pilus periplasmic chaperone [Sphingopyxis lindanitolerans]PQM28581.1 molecular chaperone [Sphingopyxis lindanitolerans]